MAGDPGSWPPPAISTRPSGSSSAVEWYSRPIASDATVRQVSVAGFQISAGSTALLRSTPSEGVMPPLADTVPSGSIVRFSYERGDAIGAVDRPVGGGWVLFTAAGSGFAVDVSAPV